MKSNFVAAAICGAILWGTPTQSRATDPLLKPWDFNRPIRVACVGDSITLGRGTSANKSSYPAQLGRMLGSQWQVGNFGSGGAAVLKLGGKSGSYWSRPPLKKALAFELDVVIFEFGANDAVNDWAANGRDFNGDYAALLDSFAMLSTKPRLIVAGLTPVSARYGFSGAEKESRAEIVPLLPKIAKENKTLFVDLLPESSLKPDTLYDGIHPDAAGSGTMAQVVYELLTGTNYTGKLPVPE